MTIEKMTIGQLAKQVGLGVETLRFYERNALLPEPERSASGYRLYGIESEDRLRFILKAKEVGFSLSDIADLLELRLSDAATAADVRQKTQEKIGDIEKKIQNLTHMKMALTRLVSACDGSGPTDRCPILLSLESGDAS